MGKIAITSRHPFFAGKKKDPTLTESVSLIKTDGAVINLTMRQVEALYYVSESDTAEFPLLKSFSQAINGLLKRSIIKQANSGFALTKVGADIVAYLKDKGLMPAADYVP